MSPATLGTLSDLLGVVEAALDRGDGPAAAEAVQQAVRACAELGAGGMAVDRTLLTRLADRQRQLLERAVHARDALAEQLRAAGQSRRATTAYGRR